MAKPAAQLDREIAEFLASGGANPDAADWDVAMDAVLIGDRANAARIVRKLRTAPTPGFLRAVAERGSTDPAEWPQIFDSLKPGQTVYIAMTAVMGSGRGPESGTYYPHKVGRRSVAKVPRWWSEAITLMPADGSKRSSFAGYKLWKGKGRETGEPYVSMSSGDMGVTIKGIYAL
jgi:hypothetical protein